MAIKRLTILSDAEIKFYYEPKTFAPDEQQYYFTLDSHEENIVNNIGSTSSKLYFILLLGYFKATQQLFDLNMIKTIGAGSTGKIKIFPNIQEKNQIENKLANST